MKDVLYGINNSNATTIVIIIGIIFLPWSLLYISSITEYTTPNIMVAIIVRDVIFGADMIAHKTRHAIVIDIEMISCFLLCVVVDAKPLIARNSRKNI